MVHTYTNITPECTYHNMFAALTCGYRFYMVLRNGSNDLGIDKEVYMTFTISILTRLNNTIYATLARPQRPHWLPRLNIIFECQMSGHFKSMYERQHEVQNSTKIEIDLKCPGHFKSIYVYLRAVLHLYVSVALQFLRQCLYTILHLLHPFRRIDCSKISF